MKGLVVIDYQNDFVNGTLGFAGAEKLEQSIVNRVSYYMNNKFPINFTLDTHYSDYDETREGKHLPVSHCIKGTYGHELFGPELKRIYYSDFKTLKRHNITLIEKSTFGTFNFNFPEEIKEIEVCGLVTNICVISCIVCLQTKFPNVEITIDSKLVNSFSKELHEKTLDVLEGLQVKVKR